MNSQYKSVWLHMERRAAQLGRYAGGWNCLAIACSCRFMGQEKTNYNE